MVVLDVTIVNIALPSAQKALQFSTGDRQWIITAYALTFGSLLLLGGKLGDLFGRKWTFVAGLLGFAGASAIGGLAPSFSVLVAARALQGSFGALLAPSALSLLTITFQDSPDRPKAFGIFSAIAAAMEPTETYFVSTTARMKTTSATKTAHGASARKTPLPPIPACL